MDYSQMNHDAEMKHLKIVIATEGFNFFENAEVNTILREEWNDDVQKRYAEKHPALAYPDSDDMLDFTMLTDELFDELLQELINESTVELILMTGDVYSVVKEELNNQMLDSWAKEHLTTLFNTYYLVISDSPMVFGLHAVKIGDDEVEITHLDEDDCEITTEILWSDLVNAELTDDSYFTEDSNGESVQLSFYKTNAIS